MGRSTTHPYPLIRGGGLFLIAVGLGFLIAWLDGSRWVAWGVAGFVVGFVASGLSALIPPPLGAPTRLQVGALFASIVFEVVLILWAVRRFEDDERTFILAILIIVGLHFVIMGFTHGPLIAVLGVVTVINGALGLLLPALPLRPFGLVDALLKMGFGAWMFFRYPRWGEGGKPPPPPPR